MQCVKDESADSMEGEKLLELRLAAGHNKPMAIVARSSGSGKAQILQLTSRACEGAKYRPAEVGKVTKKNIEDMVLGMLTVPASRCPRLADVRAYAKGAKVVLLSSLDKDV